MIKEGAIDEVKKLISLKLDTSLSNNESSWSSRNFKFFKK